MQTASSAPTVTSAHQPGGPAWDGAAELGQIAVGQHPRMTEVGDRLLHADLGGGRVELGAQLALVTHVLGEVLHRPAEAEQVRLSSDRVGQHQDSFGVWSSTCSTVVASCRHERAVAHSWSVPAGV